jgi:uncharacterized membrane protein YqjE
MQTPDRPLADVMQAILGNLRDILRSEVRLAKAEVREETGKVKSGAALIMAGGMFGMFAFLFLLLAAFHWLAQTMPEWQAALAVTGGLGLVAAICVGIGVHQLNRMRMPPIKTLHNIGRTLRWVKAQQK